MSARVEWAAGAGDDGARLDHFVAARAGCSHAAARRLIAAGAVRLDGKRAPKGARVRAGGRVSVEGPLPGAPVAAEPALPLAVLRADARLVAVAKPAGMPTHPLRPGERGTLAGALVARFAECRDASDDPREAGFVHRLDGDTSGVVLAARDRAAFRALREAFRAGAVEKTYLALVAGDAAAREIALAIAHDPGDRRRVRAVSDEEALALDARPARTRVRPLARGGGFTLVEAVSSTGRMHQIRAHLAAAGHPLVGDPLYGGPPALPAAPGHFLHAAKIRFPHPDGGTVEVAAPLPPDRAAALAALGVTLPG